MPVPTNRIEIVGRDCKCESCHKLLPRGELRFNRPTGQAGEFHHYKCFSCVLPSTLVGGGKRKQPFMALGLSKPPWSEVVFDEQLPAEQRKPALEALKRAIADAEAERERKKAATKAAQHARRESARALKASLAKVPNTGQPSGELSCLLSLDVLILVVGGHLSLRDRLMCATCVCKGWRALRERPDMWHSLEFACEPAKLPSEYRARRRGKKRPEDVPRRAPANRWAHRFWPSTDGLRRLVQLLPKNCCRELTFWPCGGDGPNTKRTVLIVRQLGGGVRSLNLNGGVASLVLPTIRTFPFFAGLQSLHLEEADMEVSEWVHTLRAAPQLRRLMLPCELLNVPTAAARVLPALPRSLEALSVLVLRGGVGGYAKGPHGFRQHVLLNEPMRLDLMAGDRAGAPAGADGPPAAPLEPNVYSLNHGLRWAPLLSLGSHLPALRELKATLNLGDVWFQNEQLRHSAEALALARTTLRGERPAFGALRSLSLDLFWARYHNADDSHYLQATPLLPHGAAEERYADHAADNLHFVLAEMLRRAPALERLEVRCDVQTCDFEYQRSARPTCAAEPPGGLRGLGDALQLLPPTITHISFEGIEVSEEEVWALPQLRALRSVRVHQAGLRVPRLSPDALVAAGVGWTSPTAGDAVIEAARAGYADHEPVIRRYDEIRQCVGAREWNSASGPHIWVVDEESNGGNSWVDGDETTEQPAAIVMI